MRLGVIAGNRQLPIIFSRTAKQKRRDLELIAICFKGETSPLIKNYVSKTFWLRVGQLERLLEIIRKENLKRLVMVGQISPWRIFKRKHWDRTMIEFVESIDDFRPHTFFTHLIKKLEGFGCKFIDSHTYLEEFLAYEGMMSGRDISNQLWDEINFGVSVVSRYVELDVGQTIVVKDKTVVALEGIEGTDRTIMRGYRLAGKGCIVLKFSKKMQDFRFDIPIVGKDTLKLLGKIKAKALVLEPQRVLILEKRKFLDFAYELNVPVIGVKCKSHFY
ncbi:MAG: UDP-2,3-diacylglucosamine diphosphatase LpxI [Candidatus Omnitrophica bacterium]|nr:UDP-2,3-diacylglucosamine diphosphatase LpxI [Candidatus Omnitrophota bacterium]MCM8826599.1 UDP-2,3-diacylglucosamine diphosphatase LpxI [Candidatus Omnitrophota bacterium]